MTPNDIVGMAVLNGLGLIAVTDHNSFGNVESVIKAAQGKELIVLPGAEIETSEEVHVLCLFASLDDALGFERELLPSFSAMQNRPDIFGEQILYDENDNVTGVMERMLLASVSVSFDELLRITEKYGGAFIPAHVDRNSYSVLSNLGFLPPDLNIPVVEVSALGVEQGFAQQNADLLPKCRTITSSDAHYLWDIAESTNVLQLEELSPEAAIAALR